MSVNKEDIKWTISPGIAFNWSKTELETVIAHRAMQNVIHPFKDVYLEGLKGKWDKTDRLWTPNFFETLFRFDFSSTKEDNELRKEILKIAGKLLFGGIINRVMNPGCKLDEAVVLASQRKNIGKSTSLSSLMPAQEYFLDGYDLRYNTKETVENLKGKILVECAEFDGLEEKYMSRIKTSFSTATRTARVAYGKQSKDYPAMHVFAATCNDMTPLPYDPDGYRRFVFVDPDGAGEKAPEILLPEIRDQLFAQALHEYLEGNLTGKTTFEEIETIKLWSKGFMRQPGVQQCVGEAIAMIKEAGFTQFNEESLQTLIETHWQFDFDEPTKRGGDMVKAMKNAIFGTRLVHRKEGKADPYWQIKGTRDNDNQKIFEGSLKGGKFPGHESSKVINIGKFAEQDDSQHRNVAG